MEWLGRYRRNGAPPDGEPIVRLVAHHVGAEVRAVSPRVSAELLRTGGRFEGLLPPVAAAPVFATRMPSVEVLTLDDCVATGVMTSRQAAALKCAAEAHKNILVIGGTFRGKLPHDYGWALGQSSALVTIKRLAAVHPDLRAYAEVLKREVVIRFLAKHPHGFATVAVRYTGAPIATFGCRGCQATASITSSLPLKEIASPSRLPCNSA